VKDKPQLTLKNLQQLKNNIVQLNLYITFDDKSKIKKCFLNLRKYLIIEISEVIESLGFDQNDLDDCKSFIINQEILKLIKDGSSGRKLLGIVYSNPNLNDEIARGIIHYVEEVKNIEKAIFLTDKDVHDEFIELFEEAIFYPTMKKVHIVECKVVPIVWLDRLNELNEEFI